MESIAHNYGQRVLPHFASYNAHDIKASQESALKHTTEKQQQNQDTHSQHLLRNDQSPTVEQHDASDINRHSPTFYFLVKKEQQEIKENIDANRSTISSSSTPPVVMTTSASFSQEHQHPHYMHVPHHIHHSHTNAHAHLMQHNELEGKGHIIRSAWQPVYLNVEAQHAASYRDREPLRVSPAASTVVSHECLNPEIRVCTPRGNSASPVIDQVKREYSPHRSNVSPQLTAMNLIKVTSTTPPLPLPQNPATSPSALQSSTSLSFQSAGINRNTITSISPSFSSAATSTMSAASSTNKPKPSPITLGVPPLSSGPIGSSPLTPATSHMPIISPSAKHPMSAFHGISTPLFLASPMHPVHFWSSLSPVTTLSPHLNSSSSAFQFPGFFNGPLTLSPLVGTIPTSSTSSMENLGTPGLVSTPTRTIPVL